MEGGTRIHHSVSIRGPLAFLFSRVIGRKIAAGLPSAVEEADAAYFREHAGEVAALAALVAGDRSAR